MRTSPFFKERITAWHDIPAREARTAPFPAWLDPEPGGDTQGQGCARAIYPPARRYRRRAQRASTWRWSRPPPRARPSATTCPCSTRPARTPGRGRSTSSRPRRSPRTSSPSCTARRRPSTADIKTFTYDGDTPPNARKLIRTAGHIVIINPDMLHTGVLPHHTKWVRLFENLQLHRHRRAAQLPRRVRLHVANVMRRLHADLRVLRLEPAVHLLARPPSPTRRSWPSASREYRPSRWWTTTARRRAPRRSSSTTRRWSTRSLACGARPCWRRTDIASQLLANDIQTIVFAPHPH